ncbi:MAG: nucleotidyltransferase family protein [Acidimicrobiia bacterium]
MVVERAVVLAAGRGTRLGAATDHLPKPMLRVGDGPLIGNIVEAIAATGVRSVTVVTGYRATTIENHLAATSPIPVSFIRQGTPHGTAAALSLARNAVGKSPFLLCWGDIATNPRHYAELVDGWRDGVAASIGVNLIDDVGRHASVVFDDNKRITQIVEKPVGAPPSLWNNSGLMVFTHQIWPQLGHIERSHRGELELTDGINGLIAAGAAVEAVPLVGSWFDIGTTEQLEAARNAFRHSR